MVACRVQFSTILVKLKIADGALAAAFDQLEKYPCSMEMAEISVKVPDEVRFPELYSEALPTGQAEQ